MTEMINLRRVRKQASKMKKRRQSAANAEKFGRSKAETIVQSKQASRARKQLDGHLRDRDA